MLWKKNSKFNSKQFPFSILIRVAYYSFNSLSRSNTILVEFEKKKWCSYLLAVDKRLRKARELQEEIWESIALHAQCNPACVNTRTIHGKKRIKRLYSLIQKPHKYTRSFSLSFNVFTAPHIGKLLLFLFTARIYIKVSSLYIYLRISQLTHNFRVFIIFIKAIKSEIIRNIIEIKRNERLLIKREFYLNFFLTKIS